MKLLLWIVVGFLITLVSSCDSGTDESRGRLGEKGYGVDIRWTSYGIPHVKAEDWGSLGYGFAYATAKDAVCVIAREVQMVNGRLSQYFGDSESNLTSDIFHLAILTDTKLSEFAAQQSERSNQMNAGYAAGYNRFLRDNKDQLPKSCAGADWVRPITESDLTRLAIGVGIRYGLGRFQQQMVQASPADNPEDLAKAQWDLPVGIGSNAVAVGKDLTASGRGILLGNPHYPWRGSSRFHMIHLTIPGELDVMGVSLLNTNRVAIGFNKDIAWTHTVSTATRFTLYQLTLNPENPREYLYQDQYRPINEQKITVTSKNEKDELIQKGYSVYFTHFGPVIETDQLPWNERVAFSLRDAVIDNYLTADTYDALGRATSTVEIEKAISMQGVYWTNTVASDRHGNAFYADISGTPNLNKQLLDRCRIQGAGVPDRLIVLRGDTKDCEWVEDPASSVSGALPPARMPRITRSDYVSNSNDSYWLSNPSAPLEGYSPIIGSEGTARSLRTRAGLSQISELIRAGNKIAPSDIQAMLYNQRNYAAEILLDDVLKICGESERVDEACGVLKSWDRTMTVDSRGGHLWREFWDIARNVPDLFAVPFDRSDPVNTPSGIEVSNESVREAVHEALEQVSEILTKSGIELDARLGDIQYAERNGKLIPIPGGEGWAGMFSMIRTRLQGDKGYTPIFHGNSYIQVISWDDRGTLRAKAMLTYSQSPEPDSPHYDDLTEVYSSGGWIDLPFLESEITSDSQFQKIRLTE
jgi:acyl-homoserine-lactone acylase